MLWTTPNHTEVMLYAPQVRFVLGARSSLRRRGLLVSCCITAPAGKSGREDFLQSPLTTNVRVRELIERLCAPASTIKWSIRAISHDWTAPKNRVVREVS